jgi:Spy/CpxP family protein refolding chaperone
MKNLLGIGLIAIATLPVLGEDAEARREFQPGKDRPAREERGNRERGGEKRGGQAPIGRILNHPEMAKKLGITDAQREAIKAQMATMQEAHIALKAQMEKAALKQARLMTETTLDEAALMAAVEETGDIRTEMARLRIKHLLFMRSTLTPEQTEKLQEGMRKRMESQRERRGDDRERRRGEFRDRGVDKNGPGGDSL